GLTLHRCFVLLLRVGGWVRAARRWGAGQEGRKGQNRGMRWSGCASAGDWGAGQNGTEVTEIGDAGEWSCASRFGPEAVPGWGCASAGYWGAGENGTDVTEIGDAGVLSFVSRFCPEAVPGWCCGVCAGRGSVAWVLSFLSVLSRGGEPVIG